MALAPSVAIKRPLHGVDRVGEQTDFINLPP
jgi:hypothetical protein